jgi:hypothetical protein
MKILNTSLNNIFKKSQEIYNNAEVELVGQGKILPSSKFDNSKFNKSFSVKFMRYVEPYTIKGVRYTLFYTEVDHNLTINDKVFIVGGNYDSDILIQSNKFSKLADGYTVLYVDKTIVVLDIPYTGDLPWEEEDDDNFIKVFVASSQEEFEYLIQQSSARDSYQYLSNKFAQKNSHSNNTFLYIDGTFSVSGNNWGVLGFTYSGNSYLTYSNSFLLYNQFGSSQSRTGYLSDITTDILSGSYSGYLSKNLHPRALTTGFVSQGYLQASQREITGIAIGFDLNTLTLVIFRTDNPHFITTPTTLTFKNLEGSGLSFSYYQNSSFTFSNFPNNPSFLYATISGHYPAVFTGGYIEKPILTSKDESIYNNGKIKIFGNDFTNSGINFKKGYVYDFDGSKWIKDISYLRPFITNLNFRFGNFKSGKFNQGLLGTHLDRVKYSGESVEFTLGSVLNTNWIKGNLGSTPIKNISYFTTFDEYGMPSIKVNSINNGGFSYNYIQDTEIKESVISNGNFNDNILGSTTSQVAVEEFLKNTNISYSVTTINGRYEDTKFNYSNIKNSTLLSSNVLNSVIQNSKSVNSDFESSVFSKSKFTSDKIIKILGYEEKFANWWNQDSWVPFKIYKFYFDKKYINRLVNFQNFYLDGLTITKPGTDIMHFFDNKFSLDSYNDSFDTFTDKKFRKTIAQISYVGDNNSTVWYQYNSLTQSSTFYGYASLDIFICATPSSLVEDFNTKKFSEESGPFIFDLTAFTLESSWGVSQSEIGLQWSGGSLTFSVNVPNIPNIESALNSLIGVWTDQVANNLLFATSTYSLSSMTFTDYATSNVSTIYQYRNKVDVIKETFTDLNTTNAYIIDSDFKSGLFKDSTWVSGNHHNYNQDHAINIYANSESFFGNININPTPKLELSIGTRNRRRLLKEGEIVFFNGIYYDTNLTGGNSLVKLPDSYKIRSINYSSSSILKVEDTINGTLSVLNFVPDSTTSTNPVLKTGFAQHAYNYAHPVKFENSIIKSGIFRRTYFQGCTLDNFDLNKFDKDPGTFDNWRNLVVSENIFIDNSNTVKSAVISNSSFVSGSDKWQNGIFYESIWNSVSFTYSQSIGTTPSTIFSTTVNKFENGIVKNSRWVNGIFGNGIFYKNNSNTAFTSSVYSESQDSYWRNRNSQGDGKTRYTWIDGTFEKGQFELSNFENGNILNADFYNSTMLDGVSNGTNFGKTNVPFALTRIATGTFSDVNVISAEFRTQDPQGTFTGNRSINWLSGVFNSGQFGVKIDSASYSALGSNYGLNATWYDGTFNNGTFMDIASWQGGKFNNGKFISYFGYPHVVAASYSTAGSQSFAWQNGEFNGGEFGNGSTGSNTTWYKGEFNGGSFKGRYWHDGIFTRGFFFGSGLTATSLDKVPRFISDFSDDFYGLWNSGWVNEVKDNFVKDKRIFSKIEREFGRKKKSLNTEFKNVLWRSGTFSHNNAQMTESVWLGGVFEKGKFYKSSFNPYASYVVNGYFKDTDPDNPNLGYWDILKSDYIDDVAYYGNLNIEDTNRFTGDTSKKLIFSGTSSIVNIYQTAGLLVGQTYELKALMLENYNTEIRFGGSSRNLRNRNFTEDAYWILAATESNGNNLPTFILATGSPGHVHYNDNYAGNSYAYLIYPDAFEIGKSYNVRFYSFNESNFPAPFVGSCDSSQISYDSGTLLTDFTVGTNWTYSVPTTGGNLYLVNLNAEYSDLVVRFSANVPSTAVKITSFIVSENDKVLTTSDISSRQMLSYSFNATDPDFSIEFIAKHTGNAGSPPTINPATSSIFSLELIKGSSGFNLSDDCRWDNGTFQESEFYVSKWNNGKWLSGTAVGMIWKNGVANYINAYNVFWEGGVWRNGNWNGSPFSYENINPNGCSYSYSYVTPAGSLTSPWDNLDLTSYPNSGLGLYSVQSLGTMSFKFSSTDGFFSPPVASLTSSNHEDSDIDPNTSGNFVNTYGLPFIKSSVDYTAGNRYKVTVTLGTVSIPRQQNSDNVGFLFSLGKPSEENIAYGQSSGTYEGSIYPSAISLAGANFISNYYLIKDLEGHLGSIQANPSTGVDEYIATSGGTVTEILDCVDDGRFYIHLNAYGVKEFWIDDVSVELESCTLRPEINDGYVSDILTNIALYRNSSSDSAYQQVFINDAFNIFVDSNFPNIYGNPLIEPQSATYTTTYNPSSDIRNWRYDTDISTYLQTFNCTGGRIRWDNNLRPNQSTQHYRVSAWGTKTTQNIRNVVGANSNYLVLRNTLLSPDLFTYSSRYEVTIKYSLHYGTLDEDFAFYDNNVLRTSVGGIDIAPPRSPRINDVYQSFGEMEIKLFGQTYNQVETFSVYKIGCNGTKYFGWSGFKTATYDFVREGNEPLTAAYTQLKIRQKARDPFVTLFITYVDIKAKNIQYDPVYNNATYSLFDSNPSYSDTLLLPDIETIGGTRNNNLITTRFGNGLFISGTASAFSSIWENGVWNEGLRFDNWVYVFKDLGNFNGTSKPLTFAGNLDLKITPAGTIASDLDRNLTKIVSSRNTWIIVLQRVQGQIEWESISSDQFSQPISFFFKVGDRVSVGNIIARDQNDKRRIIKDPFTVVQILEDVIYLQVVLNFSARRLERDSELHLIYVTKNIWLNGAFLNGLFKGVWTNGLVKGRPYITRMIDTQWADGRFDGGRFRGLTLSVYEGTTRESSEITTYHSGLIQNFIFKDADKYSSGLQHKYDSWIDVNYTTFSTVTIGRDVTTFDEDSLIAASVSFGEFSKTNHFSLPTYDVLSSRSYIRGNDESYISEYSLGYKFNEYVNYFEDIGEFNNYYNTTTGLGYLRFVGDGFSWSTSGASGKINPGSYVYLANNNGQNENTLEFRTINGYSGGQFSIDGFWTTGFLNNSSTDDFVKRRYSYVSYDVVLNHIPGIQDSDDFPQYKAIPLDINGDVYISISPAFFSAYGSVTLQLTVDKGNSILPKGYLNTLNRPTLNVKEYFYNKRGLNLVHGHILYGNTQSNIKISNLKMVETDAVPFFLLGTSSRINELVQAPWGSSAPFIDYENDQFSLIDSIVVTETIFQTLENSGGNVTSGGTTTEDLPTGVITVPFDQQANITQNTQIE